eukprot:2335590-Prymnesium_polylepis.1
MHRMGIHGTYLYQACFQKGARTSCSITTLQNPDSTLNIFWKRETTNIKLSNTDQVYVGVSTWRRDLYPDVWKDFPF